MLAHDRLGSGGSSHACVSDKNRLRGARPICAALPGERDFEKKHYELITSLFRFYESCTQCLGK